MRLWLDMYLLEKMLKFCEWRKNISPKNWHKPILKLEYIYIYILISHHVHCMCILLQVYPSHLLHGKRLIAHVLTKNKLNILPFVTFFNIVLSILLVFYFILNCTYTTNFYLPVNWPAFTKMHVSFTSCTIYHC